METFNVPMLAESSSTNYATEGNHHHLQHHQHQQQQQAPQQLLMPHHHKDQMLGAGSSPMLPFYSELQLQQKDATVGATPAAGTVVTANSAAASVASAASDNFSSLPTIDASQLDGGISLSGLCDRFFVGSPNPHSNSTMTLMTAASAGNNNNSSANKNNNSNNNNNNIVEAKAVAASNGGTVIIESVTMPSFANILFSHPSGATSNDCIDPALLQKNPQESSIIGPPVEYHQLKPLEVNSSTSVSVSTTNFLSSTTAQLLDFEVQVGKDDSRISTTTTTIASVGRVVGGGGATTPSAPATPTTTVSSNNNTANPTRSSLHSIEELAASSCAPKTTSPNSNSNNASNSASTTPQQQQPQQHHMQSGNHSGSNLSTDDESMSEDEFGLEIDDQGGKSFKLIIPSNEFQIVPFLKPFLALKLAIFWSWWKKFK